MFLTLKSQGLRMYESEVFIGYKVMRLEDDFLISFADSRLKFPAEKGLVLNMPGKGIYLSPNKEFVLNYYGGNTDDQEALLTLEFEKENVTGGNLTDKESEVSVSSAKTIDITLLDSFEKEAAENDAKYLKNINLSAIPREDPGELSPKEYY